MSEKFKYWKLGLFCIFAVASGTNGNAMADTARPGEIVSLSLGYQHQMTRQNIRVMITPASGLPVMYEASHPNIRGVINRYPDPVSRLSVGIQTQQELGVDAQAFGQKLTEQVTEHDQDWWDTTVFVELPTSLPNGPALIAVSGPQGLITQDPIKVEIVEGVGSAADPFAHLDLSDPTVSGNFLTTLERAEHVTVTFSGSSVPHCIQVDLLRDAGIGTPWVINPRGDLKNVTWGDDGGKLRVMLTPPNGQTPSHLGHFKFYVAGGVSGLQVTDIRAYDQEGNVMTDLTAQIRE